MISIKSREEIEIMRAGGRILADVLQKVGKSVKPGTSAAQLDKLARELVFSLGARPSFLDYKPGGSGEGYPAALCVSINDEIVHGLPDKKCRLKNGDIISLDLGAEYNGVYTDMATTIAVGNVTTEIKNLLINTKKSLQLGIFEAYSGQHVGDIGAKIEEFASTSGLGIIRDYVGHGIGTKPHLPPQIPNFGTPGTGVEIVENMALAIEPMLTLGGEGTKIGADGWVVKTADGSLAAHFEHTIIIENGQPLIVTQ